MEEEERLELSLKEYQTQLETVDLALEQAGDDNDLSDLKSSLEEVIRLTEENLLSVKKQRLLSEIKDKYSEENCENAPSSSEMDREFDKFQTEMDESSTNEESKKDAGLLSLISELEGKKCRAPYVEAWGQRSHQNAFVMSVEVEREIGHLEDLQVRVLFCNPLCDGMKPCPFFLDGECRFAEDSCRFSHGHLVKLIDVEEFKDPDYSCLEKGSSCLAKYSDGLWYPAIIEECLEDHTFVVLYNRYNQNATLKIEDIFPIDQDDSSSDDEDDASLRMLSDSEGDENGDTPSVLWLSINASQQPLGEWEKHTKGIASKLMEKMGYVWGQGLGKNGDGRLDPIQARIFPQGKSLDKCMELREKGAIKDPMKRNTAKKEVQKIAGRYHNRAGERRNVFDFLNNKIAKHKGEHPKASGSKTHDASKKQDHAQLKEKSNRALNIGSLQLTEEVRKAERELEHLHRSLSRNKDRDKVMTSQIETKITSQKELISQLRMQEKVIQNEQQTRKNHHKLCVF